MKLLLFIFILIMIPFIGFSQDSKRSEAYDLFKAGEIDKAKQLIDEACVHSETKDHPKTWYFKALIYKELAKQDTEHKLNYYPAEVAFKAIQESKRLDEKGLFVNENMNELLNLSTMFLNIGSVYYNEAIKNDDENYYKKALREFDNFFFSLNSLGKDSMVVIDFLKQNNMPYTDILVYSGYAAYNSKNNTKAKKYYNQLTSMPAEDLQNDKEGIPYAFIVYTRILSDEAKHDRSVELINKALNIWPGDNKLELAELKVYQNAGRTDEIKAKYEKVIVNDPTNVNLMIALAEKYDRLQQDFEKNNDFANSSKYRDEAIETYKRAIALKPADKTKLYNLYFNLGLQYYNPAVDLYQKYTMTKDKAGRSEIEKKYIPLFRESITSFENAYSIIDNNKELVDMMTRIYLILDDMDKATEMKEKYKSIE